MSVDGGDFAGLSPRESSYLARLESIFPSLDPRVIRYTIEQKGAWSEIVEALLSPDIAKVVPPPRDFPSVAKSQDPKMFMPAPEARKPKRQGVDIDTKATQYEGDCLLYLPQEIALLDMDLDTFGLFDDDTADERFRTPYGVYGKDVPGAMRQPRH